MAGLVTYSCGRWIEAREFKAEEYDRALVYSLQGFLSGLNFMRGALRHKLKPGVNYSKRFAVIPDPSTILLYVDKSCRDNPLERIWMGLSRLWLELPNKQKD